MFLFNLNMVLLNYEMQYKIYVDQEQGCSYATINSTSTKPHFPSIYNH